MGREYQKAVERGFETASRSFSEANRGFQALAAEMTDFSKRRWEDVFRAWEQLLRARHFGDVVEVQAKYAQGAFEAYASKMSKLGEMCLSTARLQASRRRFKKVPLVEAFNGEATQAPDRRASSSSHSR
jgi:hypothetical protein